MTVQSIEKTAPLRTANKSQTAAWFDVSLATIDAWIRRGAPCVTRGAKGSAWVFDLRDLARWYFGKQSSPGADETLEGDPDKLSPKERLDWYRGNREKMRHRLEAGELIEAEQYRAALSAVLKVVAATLEDLPDRMEREAHLPGAAVEVAVRVVDDLREQMFRRIVETADQMSEPKPPE
jgi:phage terminase Nu1 subunit (DNA packaging protein)